MSHIMERLAYRKERAATIRADEHEGIRTISWVDKGTVIHQVSEKLLKEDAALLLIGRWHKLEYRPDYRSYWMTRDVWFWWLVTAAWRLSLALHYWWLGLTYGIRALRGQRP